MEHARTMDTIRTWSGKFFGWIDDDGLFARDGRHVGQIYRGIVYAENGHYLGELREGRLITHVLRKDTHRWYGFFANPERTTGDRVSDGEPLTMPEGYEDFPDLAVR
jgi:4-fold beta flower protein